jgi:predicted patatin/cPLA2 family phospholipase
MNDILKIDKGNDTDKKNNIPNYDFDTLVLSGGSSKGIMILGALQYAYDNFLLNKIDKYIGTSVGSIICFLLLIGYTPIEIMVYLCTHEILEKLQHFNIVAMINGNGALSYSGIYEQLEKMTIDKIGYLPTFKDIKEKYGKQLICATYNLTYNKTEYLSFENNPNLPCLIGIKMSSNLPLIFEKFKYNNNFYIDGGISDDFAIDIGDKMGDKILGIVITIDNNSFNSEGESILEYIYKLIFIPISQSMDSKINNASNNCKIIKLSYNKLKFFNFNVNSKEKLDIFSIGYENMKEQIG